MKFQNIFAAAFLFTSTVANPLPESEIESRAINGPGRVAPGRGGRLQKQRPTVKYFQEPGGDNELGHYDARYFQKVVTYEERRDTLQHLVRSYLTVFRERNIETWIAHGTLLGWWWNGKIMPWDWDLDTQVSAATLTWLAENLNMTMHNYTSTNTDGEVVSRNYLLDVNPNHVDRARGDGMNVIDARWVDMTNGLFIDITGLAETNPANQPGIWSCKNFHRYRTRDIYPLRETVFEGVTALVPYAFDRVLTEEYSARALTKTMHEGHRWDAEQKEWIQQENVKFNAGPISAGQGEAVAHKPRSLLSDGAKNSQSGLANLRKLL